MKRSPTFHPGMGRRKILKELRRHQDPRFVWHCEACLYLDLAPTQNADAVLHFSNPRNRDNRMPVILPRVSWDEWLDPENEDVEGLKRLTMACPSEVLDAVRESSKPEGGFPATGPVATQLGLFGEERNFPAFV